MLCILYVFYDERNLPEMKLSVYEITTDEQEVHFSVKYLSNSVNDPFYMFFLNVEHIFIHTFYIMNLHSCDMVCIQCTVHDSFLQWTCLDVSFAKIQYFYYFVIDAKKRETALFVYSLCLRIV